MILNYLELVNLPGELFTWSRIANPREPENRRRIWAQSACDIYFIIFSYALHLLWRPLSVSGRPCYILPMFF